MPLSRALRRDDLIETNPALVSELTGVRAKRVSVGSACGPGYELQGSANHPGPDDDEAAIMMEHLWAPFRRQHAGSRESLSDANRNGLIGEAQKSANNTAAMPARVARR